MVNTMVDQLDSFVWIKEDEMCDYKTLWLTFFRGPNPTLARMLWAAFSGRVVGMTIWLSEVAAVISRVTRTARRHACGLRSSFALMGGFLTVGLMIIVFRLQSLVSLIFGSKINYLQRV